MIKRRVFILGIAGDLLASPLFVEAQQVVGKVPRIRLLQPGGRFVALQATVLLICLSTASAAVQTPDTCRLGLPPKSPNWTEQEHWSWKQLCEGREADLRKYGGTDGSAVASDWPDKRDLTQRFLE